MNKSNPKSPIVIQPLSGRPLKPGVKWSPVQGEYSSKVVTSALSDAVARERLIESAAEILGAGVSPDDKTKRETGLVVGYVQSGKTLSFTTVIGFARDNGFPLVIVVAGNKDSLLNQSHVRLAHDLDVDGGEGLPAWIMEKNPRTQNVQHEQLLRQAVDNWKDKTRDADEKPTLLLTVLKQNQRLAALTTLLQTIDLRETPVLVIDDEADQASLNTKVNQNNESTTYSRLRELRDALPLHTFLQYTATPQAPLLINIADTLSPNFVHVLDPGDGYVGGATFFAPGSPYVSVIPQTDIATRNAMPVDPPDSLLDALRLFFVGLAASIIGRRGRRSMLVHPDRTKLVHQLNAQWATAAKEEWHTTLSGPPTDPDRRELIADFKNAYDDLATTEPSLPDFMSVIEKLPRALRNTTVIEFNTRGSPKTPEIRWRNSEGWILVGGQAVDRGFTVDSLTVTYMARGIGVGNADTLQQRARFFGYARAKGYFGLCRVYLEQNLKDAFEEYVEHEEIMRRELKRVASTGESLNKWRRRLVLDPALHPCRRSVISDNYIRARPGGGWTLQRGALLSPKARESNSAVLAWLTKELEFVPDTSYISKEAAQKHLVSRDVSLSTIIDALVEYRCEDPRDTASLTGLLVTLGEALRRDENAIAAVYQMRPGTSTRGTRTLSDLTLGTIDFFLQGKTNLADGTTAYPGDEFFKTANRLSLQLHQYDLKFDGRTVAEAAPLIAFHVPQPLAKSWLVQIQRGQIAS